MSRQFHTTSTATLLLGLSAALSTACSDADSTQPSAGSDRAATNDAPAAPGANPDHALESGADLLTEHTTHDSVSYRFLQLETGELALEMSAESGDVHPLMPESRETYVEFFERLTNSPAPEVLADAQFAAVNAEIGAAPNGAAGEGVSGNPARKPLDAAEQVALEWQSSESVTVGQSPTVTQLQAKNCPDGYDFVSCFPAATGSPWVQWTGTYMAGVVSPSTCSVRFRIRYDDGGWKTLIDRLVSAGSSNVVWTNGRKYPRRFELLNAGCSTHFSVWGS